MSTKPYNKTALTFAQQVDLLEARGLNVGNRRGAEALLSRVSYYRLSAYWLLFKLVPGDRFEDTASLAEAERLYEFDRRLRLLVMDAIERVEIAVRTTVTYHLVHAYGPYGHEASVNFHPQFRHPEWIDKLHREAERSEETFILHYENTYDGFPSLPLWVASEVMSLGSLSVLFRGLHHDDKRAVAGSYRVHHRVFGDWLHTLSYVRNLCAHHGRLWNRDLAIKPTMPEPRNPRSPTTEERCWIPPALPDRHHVYGVLLILRYLLRHHQAGSHWSGRVQALLTEMDSHPRWQVAMGLPANWRTHSFWTT